MARLVVASTYVLLVFDHKFKRPKTRDGHCRASCGSSFSEVKVATYNEFSIQSFKWHSEKPAV